MINLYGAQIETLSVHKVGNRAKNEGTYITKAALKLTGTLFGFRCLYRRFTPT